MYFEYHNVPQLSSFGSLTELRPDDAKESWRQVRDFHPLGFNMCETGLEGVKISISKKSSNKAS